MPIYEYECNKCGQRFEKLVNLDQSDNILCPYCNTSNPRKLLSLFSSNVSSESACNPGGST